MPRAVGDDHRGSEHLMALDDLRELLDQPELKLPIGGRVFVVLPCNATTWLKLQEVYDAASVKRDALIEAQEKLKTLQADSNSTADDITAAVLALSEAANARSDVSDLDLFRMSLGAVFEAMLDHVTGPELRQAGTTAWLWQLGKQGLAEAFWTSGGKASEPAGESTGTSTGEAPSTSRRASSSSTNTPRKSTARSRPKNKG